MSGPRLIEEATIPVSLIIPAYNAQGWIGETIRRALAMDYPPGLLEIVVVDDGSTDGTVEEARTALRSGSVAWRVHACPHGGPSRARNLGARLTRGQWFQFLDADDLVGEEKLRIQTGIARGASAEVAVVYSAWAALKQEKGKWTARAPLRLPKVGSDPVMDLLISENFIATGSQIVNRLWFERVGGFDERSAYVEDVDLGLRIAMAGGRYVCAGGAVPLFFYRQRTGSQSRGNPLCFAEACVRNARLAEAHWRERQSVLRVEQTDLLLRIYGNALRTFFELDRASFHALLARVEALAPYYRPANPARLRWLSYLVGYRRAEGIALAYRRIGRALSKLGAAG